MKDGAPFGLGGIWENWKQPSSGEWLRTFATVRSRSRDAAQVWYVASLRTHARLSQCLYLPCSKRRIVGATLPQRACEDDAGELAGRREGHVSGRSSVNDDPVRVTADDGVECDTTMSWRSSRRPSCNTMDASETRNRGCRLADLYAVICSMRLHLCTPCSRFSSCGLDCGTTWPKNNKLLTRQEKQLWQGGPWGRPASCDHKGRPYEIIQAHRIRRTR